MAGAGGRDGGGKYDEQQQQFRPGGRDGDRIPAAGDQHHDEVKRRNLKQGFSPYLNAN
jgi:hypothetical protein